MEAPRISSPDCVVFINVYLHFGIPKSKLCNYQEAIDNYNRAIELNPECPKIHYHCRIVQSKLDDYKETHADFDKAKSKSNVSQ